MFLNKIKDFFIKKTFKKSLHNVKLTDTNHPVNTVGILFDESCLHQKEALLKNLTAQGIKPGNIRFMVFRNAVRKNEQFDYPVFSYNDISWGGNPESKAADDFTAMPFDLLISYYDTGKAPLMLVTQKSKAVFKVGFSEIDSRLNHFMISTPAENHNIFTDELFKYLKILNKI